MKTIRVGLVGSGIEASLSPAMHMAEGAAHGLEYHYELFDLSGSPLDRASLISTIANAEMRGFRGLNVTHPYKQIAVDCVDELSPDASALGSINTIIFDDGRRVGHNTDWSGYADGFRRALPNVSLNRVVQLGAGGAGAAVAHALMVMGAGCLTLYDRDTQKALTVAVRLAERFGQERIVVANDLQAALSMADGLVNATPIGMAAYPGMAISANLLRSDLWVSEIVYLPLRTQLVAAAEQLGCQISDGGGMAVFQAVHAFRLFTGLEPKPDRMLEMFERLRNRNRS